MCVYNNKKVVEKDEQKALGILLQAQSKGLDKCSRRMMNKVEQAVVLLSSRGFMVSIY